MDTDIPLALIFHQIDDHFIEELNEDIVPDRMQSAQRAHSFGQPRSKSVHYYSLSVVGVKEIVLDGHVQFLVPCRSASISGRSAHHRLLE